MSAVPLDPLKISQIALDKSTNSSLEIIEGIMKQYHSSLIGILEDPHMFINDVDSSKQGNSLEEDKKYHEKQFKLFKQQKIQLMGAGHGSSMNSGVAMGGPTQITLQTNGGIVSRNN